MLWEATKGCHGTLADAFFLLLTFISFEWFHDSKLRSVCLVCFSLMFGKFVLNFILFCTLFFVHMDKTIENIRVLNILV